MLLFVDLNHMILVFIAGDFHTPCAVAVLELFGFRKAECPEQVFDHGVFGGLVVIAADGGDALLPALCHKGVQHCQFHIPFQYTAAHQPQFDVQGVAGDLSNNDGNNAVVAELVPQPSVQANVLVIGSHLFHFALGIPPCGQVELVALVGQLDNAGECYRIKIPNVCVHIQPQQIVCVVGIGLLHLGTLVAVFVAYWQDICDMVREFFCGIGDLVHHSTPTPVPPARRLILLIILGTLPLFAILPIKDTVEGLKNSMVFIGAALIVTGFLLFFSDRARKGRKDARSATVLDVLVVGVSQAIATVPGISRSGMTITTGCFVGFERRFAVRFSFLLSIPAVLGANILSLKDALTGGVDWSQLPVYLAGVVVAAVSGYLCIRLLKMIADKGRFGAFAYYCWAAGLATLILNAVK